MNYFKTIAVASVTAVSLFSCQKEINNHSFSKPSNDSNASEKATSVVWGLGPDNRVYKWNSSINSWSEPNPAARLSKISVGQDNTGAVWGISVGHVYRWNGVSWDEMNPAIRMGNLSAYSATVVWAISEDAKSLFKTTDGGLTWTAMPLTGITGASLMTINSVSTMAGADAIIVMSNGVPYKYTTTGWQSFGSTAFQMNLTHASGSGNLCWAVQKSPYNVPYGDVLKYDGTYWTQPNPAAKLVSISMSDESVVWGIGNNYHVYRWNAGINAWDEPNPAAGLKVVSSGN